MNILLINSVFRTEEGKASIGGVEYHRMAKPHIVLKRLYPEYDLLMADSILNVPEKQLEETNLVIFSRQIPLAEAEQLNLRNIPYGLDLDDYWYLPEHHIAYEDYKKFNTAEETENSIKLAHFVICTTSFLADKIRPFNNNITVIENGIDTEDPTWKPNKTESKRLRFGFTQGNTHVKDIQSISNSVAQCLDEAWFFSKGQIVLCGFYGEDSSWQNVTVEQYYELILTKNHKALRHNKEYLNRLSFLAKTDEYTNEAYRRIWAVHVDTFGTVYNEFDVSVSPLIENEFNACKSELKMLEAASKDCAIMLHHVKPYTILATDKNSFDLRKKSFREWSKILINNPNLVADSKAQLVEDVKRYDLKVLAVKRDNLYKKYKK